MTEPVLSSFVPAKGNMRGSLLPQSGDNYGLGIVGLCYAQSNYVFKVAVGHIGWHVTFQAHDQEFEKHSQGEGNAGLN